MNLLLYVALLLSFNLYAQSDGHSMDNAIVTFGNLTGNIEIMNDCDNEIAVYIVDGDMNMNHYKIVLQNAMLIIYGEILNQGEISYRCGGHYQFETHRLNGSSFEANRSRNVHFKKSELNRTQDTLMFVCDSKIKSVEFIDRSKNFTYEYREHNKDSMSIPIKELPKGRYMVITKTESGHWVVHVLNQNQKSIKP